MNTVIKKKNSIIFIQLWLTAIQNDDFQVCSQDQRKNKLHGIVLHKGCPLQCHQKQHLLCPLSTARNRGNQTIFPLKLVFDCLIRTDQKLRKPSSKTDLLAAVMYKGEFSQLSQGCTALGGYRLCLSMFGYTVLSSFNLGSLSNI